MRKLKKVTFHELVNENKREIMEDQKVLQKIEERIERRAQEKLKLK